MPLRTCVGLTHGFVYSGGSQGPLCVFAFQLCVDVQFVFSLMLLVTVLFYTLCIHCVYTVCIVMNKFTQRGTAEYELQAYTLTGSKPASRFAKDQQEIRRDLVV